MAVPYKICMSLYLLFLVFIALGGTFACAQLEKFNQPAKDDGSLSFLVIGDWGRRGGFNQSEVASQVIPFSHYFVFFKNFNQSEVSIDNVFSVSKLCCRWER